MRVLVEVLILGQVQLLRELRGIYAECHFCPKNKAYHRWGVLLSSEVVVFYKLIDRMSLRLLSFFDSVLQELIVAS
jgi:hypothetical protein